MPYSRETSSGLGIQIRACLSFAAQRAEEEEEAGLCSLTAETRRPQTEVTKAWAAKEPLCRMEQERGARAGETAAAAAACAETKAAKCPLSLKTGVGATTAMAELEAPAAGPINPRRCPCAISSAKGAKGRYFLHQTAETAARGFQGRRASFSSTNCQKGIRSTLPLVVAVAAEMAEMDFNRDLVCSRGVVPK